MLEGCIGPDKRGVQDLGGLLLYTAKIFAQVKEQPHSGQHTKLLGSQLGIASSLTPELNDAEDVEC